MAGGRGVAGEAGTDDAELGLSGREPSASAIVLGDHRNFSCFLSPSAPARRCVVCHSRPGQISLSTLMLRRSQKSCLDHGITAILSCVSLIKVSMPTCGDASPF